jgi:hypothetical protein
VIEYLQDKNKERLDKLNLPNFTGKIKVMVMEEDIPYDLGFLGVKEVVKTGTYAMHASWTAQVIKIINPDAELYASKIDFPAVVDYCIENNIKIINASFTCINNASRREALERYHRWGGIFVAASGNDADRSVYFPANSPHTIAVAGTNVESSVSKELDVYTEGNIYVRNKTEGMFHYYNGTSSCAPVIAGCISLILAKYPNWNCEDVRKFLKENSKPFDKYAGVFSFLDGFELENSAPIPEVPKGDESMFKDVKETDWFHKAVKWTKDKGILKGYPDGTFKPNEPLTRAEYAQAEYNKAHKGE